VVIEKYENLVAHLSYEFARKFRMLDVGDIRQELWVWFLEHPNKIKTWEKLDDKQSIKLIARSLRNAAKDYCQKEKAKIVGYKVEDNYYYDKSILELLLPAVLRGHSATPTLNDINFTSNKKIVSEGNNWFAMIADVENAIKKMSDEQFEVIYCRFGDGVDNAKLAEELEISEDAARMRVNRAMNSLLNILGGSRPRKERDYEEDENGTDSVERDVGDFGEQVEGPELD